MQLSKMIKFSQIFLLVVVIKKGSTTLLETVENITQPQIPGNRIGVFSSRDPIFAAQSLVSRQSFQCSVPGGAQCSASTCCAPGNACFEGGCCPDNAQRCDGTACGPVGSVCCNGYLCPSGLECNSLGNGKQNGCCLPNEIKCPDACCPAGSTCGGSSGTCSNDTRSSTSTRTMATGTATKTMSKYTSCPPIQNSNGKPTFTIPYYQKATKVPGGTSRTTIDNREIMQNMCEGIKKNKKCIGLQMELTYDTADRSGRRNKMCPDDYCDKFNVPCSSSAGPGQLCNPYANLLAPGIFDGLDGRNPFRFNCDEFPFASSAQGGDLTSGIATCVPGYSNSAQGQRLTGLKSKVGEGNNYILELGGWDCDSNRPLAKRALDPTVLLGIRDTNTTQSLGQSDLFNNVTDDGQSALQVYFGDIDAGTHSSELSIASGTFSSLQVVDYLGFILAEVTNGFGASSTKQSVVFKIDQPATGVGLWLYTHDTNVSLFYQISGNTASGSRRTSGSTQLLPRGMIFWGIVLGVLGILLDF